LAYIWFAILQNFDYIKLFANPAFGILTVEGELNDGINHD